jgi:hypothetical protein
MSDRESGQASLLGILLVLFFGLLFVAGADFYRIYELRSWSYRQAASAARGGSVIAAQWAQWYDGDPGLDVCAGWAAQSEAVQQAQYQMQTALTDRGLWEHAHTAAAAIPAGQPTQLPEARRALNPEHTEELIPERPMLAVYGEIDVPTYFGALIGRPTIPVTYYASADVFLTGGAPDLAQRCTVTHPGDAS